MAESRAAIATRLPAATHAASTRLGALVPDHPLISLFTLALFVRVLLVAMSGLFEGFVLDDGTYHQMATSMAEGDISHWDDFTYSLFWRTAAFLAPVTALYKVFGAEIVVGQLYVAVLGSVTVVVGTRLALEFLSRTWAIVVGVLLALIPSQAFWSAQLMKDASVWLSLVTLALLIALANRSTGRKLLAYGLGITIVLCALAFLREHTLVVAAWGTMIGSLAGIREHRVQRIGGALLVGVAIPWLVAASGPAGLGLVTNAGSLQELRFKMAQGANTAIVDTTPGGTEEELEQVRQQRREVEAAMLALQKIVDDDADARAGTVKVSEPEVQMLERLRDRYELPGAAKTRSDRAREVQVAKQEVQQLIAVLQQRLESIADRQQSIQQPPPAATLSEEGTVEPNVAHLPRGLSVMLLEPFPIPFEGSPSLRLARLESLLWYPLLMFAGVGLWHARSYLRYLLFPVVVGGGILLMYALSEGNVGTAHRHRGEFVWVVVLLAALGASHLAQRRTAKAPTRE